MCLPTIANSSDFTASIIGASLFPECPRRLSFQAREELAEGGGVGEVETVGYLGDAQLRGAQQERGLHDKHLVDVVDNGVSRDLADNTREVDGTDMERRGVKRKSCHQLSVEVCPLHNYGISDSFTTLSRMLKFSTRCVEN